VQGLIGYRKFIRSSARNPALQGGEDVNVNGSLIGPGEYSIGKLRAFPERPQQALWFVHPTNGIVSQQAVYCEAPPEQTSHEWVSWAGTAGVT
jgi:hypothetical protein